jgi:hypothetical protein
VSPRRDNIADSFGRRENIAAERASVIVNHTSPWGSFEPLKLTRRAPLRNDGNGSRADENPGRPRRTQFPT